MVFEKSLHNKLWQMKVNVIQVVFALVKDRKKHLEELQTNQIGNGQADNINRVCEEFIDGAGI